MVLSVMTYLACENCIRSEIWCDHVVTTDTGVWIYPEKNLLPLIIGTIIYDDRHNKIFTIDRFEYES